MRVGQTDCRKDFNRRIRSKVWKDVSGINEVAVSSIIYAKIYLVSRFAVHH